MCMCVRLEHECRRGLVAHLERVNRTRRAFRAVRDIVVKAVLETEGERASRGLGVCCCAEAGLMGLMMELLGREEIGFDGHC